MSAFSSFSFVRLLLAGLSLYWTVSWTSCQLLPFDIVLFGKPFTRSVRQATHTLYRPFRRRFLPSCSRFRWRMRFCCTNQPRSSGEWLFCFENGHDELQNTFPSWMICYTLDIRRCSISVLKLIATEWFLPKCSTESYSSIRNFLYH